MQLIFLTRYTSSFLFVFNLYKEMADDKVLRNPVTDMPELAPLGTQPPLLGTLPGGDLLCTVTVLSPRSPCPIGKTLPRFPRRVKPREPIWR